jgi:Hint domain
VETLKRGDLVLTSDGRSVPVDWLGIQTVSLMFADKMRVLPIRIRAGALAENGPSRDLLVSPDHALLVDGALIQAGTLVNGTSHSGNQCSVDFHLLSRRSRRPFANPGREHARRNLCR